MAMHEAARAFLLSEMDLRIKDAGGDPAALRSIIVELESAQADVLLDIEQLRREEEWFAEHGEPDEEDSPLRTVREEIAEVEAELKRIVEGLDRTRAALARASKSEGAPEEKGTEKKIKRAGKKADGAKKAAKKTAKPRKKQRE